MIQFKCTDCGAMLRAPDEHAGKQCKCGKCGAIVGVPSPEAPLEEFAEAASAPQSVSDGVASNHLAPQLAGFVAKVGLIAGIATAAGYLFLLCFTAIKYHEIPWAQAIITACVLGILAGGTAAVVSYAARGLAQTITIGALGLFLVILPMVLACQMKVSPQTASFLGSGSAVSATDNNVLSSVAFALMVLLLGAIHARTSNFESLLIRWLVGALAAALLIMELVYWLMFISGNNELTRAIPNMFSNKQIVPIVFFIWMNAVCLAILIVGLISAIRQDNGTKLAKISIVLAKVAMWSVVVLVSLDFIIAVTSVDSNSGNRVGLLFMVWMLALVGGLVPLFGAIYLCVSGLSGTLALIVTLTNRGPLASPATMVAGNRQEVSTPTAAAASGNVQGKLEQLKQLLEQGMITSQDYDAKKRELLGHL